MRATELYKAMRLDKSLDTHAHLDFLNALGASHERILEIGVHCGISTTAFLSGMEMVGGGHLWSIDTHPSCRYVHFGHPLWTFYCPWSGDVPAPDLPLDVLFIDGEHTREAVLSDLNRWGHHAKLILLHDADTPSFPGVRTAIEEYSNTHNLKHELRKGSSGLEVIYR